jgi:uncharacterized protein YfaS (alpha-2-macroglobulin family)
MPHRVLLLAVPARWRTSLRKAKIRKPGRVEKIIKSPVPTEPEKAEIRVDGADPLYREIRIENTLHDEEGKKVKLKKGDEVEVVVEADKAATTATDS